MELQSHAKAFINGTDLAVHESDFDNNQIIYLSIEHSEKGLAGYFILSTTPGDTTIEFRRILIDQHLCGVGQIAIGLMESYCREILKASQIWLDVYEDNHKGKHIYEKLGYEFFEEAEFEGRKLLYYKKLLNGVAQN